MSQFDRLWNKRNEIFLCLAAGVLLGISFVMCTAQASAEGQYTAKEYKIMDKVKTDKKIGKELSRAVDNGDTLTAKALITRFSDPNDEALVDAFYKASCMGNTAIVREILADGMAVASNDKYVAKAVKCATNKNHDSVVELIKRAQAGELIKTQEEEAADTAAKAGNRDEALSQYIAALKNAPADGELDRRLREKIIRYALSIKPQPAISEEARHHATKGMLYVKKAEDRDDYDLAIVELAQASRLAPWWPDIYRNLGLVLEKAEQFDRAIISLKLYLLATPDANDNNAVQYKIGEIEVEKELAKQQSVKEREEDSQKKILKRSQRK